MRISDWSSDVCSSDLVGSRIRLDLDEAPGTAVVAHPQLVQQFGVNLGRMTQVEAARHLFPPSHRHFHRPSIGQQKTPHWAGFLSTAMPPMDGAGSLCGARERTRTSTELPPLAPEASASTNSATRAGGRVCCVAALALSILRTLGRDLRVAGEVGDPPQVQAGVSRVRPLALAPLRETLARQHRFGLVDGPRTLAGPPDV